MGITIHYSGRLKSAEALTQLVAVATAFAAVRGWQVLTFDEPTGTITDRDLHYAYVFGGEPPFRGVLIQPHAESEPVRLLFDANLRVATFTKTQFAPFGVHVEVVDLLRIVEPFMAEFEVLDEAGLWERGDIAAARRRFDGLGGIINAVGQQLRDDGLHVRGPGVPVSPRAGDSPRGEPYG